MKASRLVLFIIGSFACAMFPPLFLVAIVALVILLIVASSERRR